MAREKEVRFVVSSAHETAKALIGDIDFTIGAEAEADASLFTMASTEKFALESASVQLNMWDDIRENVVGAGDGAVLYRITVERIRECEIEETRKCTVR